jgi:hypothetical protein
MKVKIAEDELYPFYTSGLDYGVEVEVPEDFYERYKRVMREFARLQGELGELYEKATSN